MYAEINTWSQGTINLIKKVNDSRPNRPVGSYVKAKNINHCGTLLFSSFKDKNIGHSIGRIDNGETENSEK